MVVDFVSLVSVVSDVVLLFFGYLGFDGILGGGWFIGLIDVFVVCFFWMW